MVVVVVGVMGMTLMAGCKTTTSDRDIKDIGYDRLESMMLAATGDKSGELVIVDPRSTERFEEAHIPGAINIPLPDMGPSDARLAEAKFIVIYGADLRDPLAPVGAKKLIAWRYSNVLLFRPGLDFWRAKGRAVEP